MPNKKWIGSFYCPFRTHDSISRCIHPSNVHEGRPEDCLLAPCPFSRKAETSLIFIELKAKGEKLWAWQERMRQEAGPVHIEPIKVVMIDEVKQEGF